MSHTPIIYDWTDDGVMKPRGRFAMLADKRFVVGESYRLEVVEERSPESHRHYFASINEAWQNLPEVHSGRWPTPEHLRKWALVKAGYRTETTYIAASKAEALRFAAFLRGLDEYAVIDVGGNVATIYTAKSQSLKEMSRKEFQASKSDVLDVLAQLIGVSTDDLQDSARGRRQSPPTVPAQRQERERVA